MKNYYIKIYSFKRVMIAIMITMVLISLIFLIDRRISINIEQNTNYVNYQNFTIIIIFLLGVYVIFKLFSFGKIRISLHDEHIKIFWVKRFFLSKKDNILIKWKDTKYYDFEQTTLCDYIYSYYCFPKFIYDRIILNHRFNIILNTGKRFKVNRYNFIFNDDFKIFKLNFINHIDKVNNDEDTHIEVITDIS